MALNIRVARRRCDPSYKLLEEFPATRIAVYPELQTCQVNAVPADG